MSGEKLPPDPDAPFYCVQDPESQNWFVVMSQVPQHIRLAILEHTNDPEAGDDWQELRSPVWAVNMLYSQAEEGSAEARAAFEDPAFIMPMPEGWNDFVKEHYDPALDPEAGAPAPW